MSGSQVSGGFWMQLPNDFVASFPHREKTNIELVCDDAPVMDDGSSPAFRCGGGRGPGGGAGRPRWGQAAQQGGPARRQWVVGAADGRGGAAVVAWRGASAKRGALCFGGE
jgi:hypothetical protein